MKNSPSDIIALSSIDLATVRGGLSRPELANILGPAAEQRDACLVRAAGNGWETQACNTHFLESVAAKLQPSLGDAIPQTSQQVCTRTSSGCFVAGTLVQTTEGLRPIELLVPGDEVISQHGISRIVRAHHASSLELVRVHTADGASVVATPWHRFFDADGKLCEAERLRSGAAMHANGSIVHVTRVDRVIRDVPTGVYNLTLASGNGFFVNGILVESTARVLARQASAVEAMR